MVSTIVSDQNSFVDKPSYNVSNGTKMLKSIRDSLFKEQSQRNRVSSYSC